MPFTAVQAIACLNPQKIAELSAIFFVFFNQAVGWLSPGYSQPVPALSGQH